MATGASSHDARTGPELMSTALRTARLVLRPFEPSDRVRVAEICNDTRVSRMCRFVPHPYTLDDADDFTAVDDGVESAHGRLVVHGKPWRAGRAQTRAQRRRQAQPSHSSLKSQGTRLRPQLEKQPLA